MLKKFLKWTMIALVSLLFIAVLFYAVIYFKTQSAINKVYSVSVKAPAIPTDSAAYKEGKHIAENRGCMGCHGDNLAGGRVFMDPASPLGVLYAANITRGKGGINFTDADWVKVLRHGLGQDNKSLWFMPSQDVGTISNHELAVLINFVKQQPPVDNTVPAKSIKPFGRFLTFIGAYPLLPATMIDHNAVYKDHEPAAITPEYGAYLATTCKGCHGPQLKGGAAHEPGQPNIPNISSTGNPGKWKDTDLITVFHTGKTPEGKQLSDYMPWKVFTYTDDELKAIYQYLHNLK